MSAPRRMKANPAEHAWPHNVEHDWSSGCDVAPHCTPIDNCDALLDERFLSVWNGILLHTERLDALAERVTAIEAEMPRIAKLEHRMMQNESRTCNALNDAATVRGRAENLEGRMADAETRIKSVKGCVQILERRADAQDTPKPAEPEHSSISCPCVGCTEKREAKEKEAAKAEWEAKAKVGAMVLRFKFDCDCGGMHDSTIVPLVIAEHCNHGQVSGWHAIPVGQTPAAATHVCHLCARVIPTCPTCGHELTKEAGK